ncbi:hypothetical protein AYI70_g3718 [Smittium culicis]|uniref:Uncharacterized protein n=1 Tax=Smittium culicis TaxID=133412 RepID=A0A1R1Y2D8_9FUNG|nr:hypothetical protein AYI70_g3718 [Smittium culicis]
MTTESIAAHEKEQIQEVPTNSTVPIVLRKKGHTENKTPPQMEPDTGGSLVDLFGSLSLSEQNSVFKHAKERNVKLNTIIKNEESGSDSEFSDTETVDKVTSMPRPGSKSAPLFDGFDVGLFLNEMKQLALTSNISTTQLASIIPRYCTATIKNEIQMSYAYQVRSWRTVKEFMTETYSKEKKRIITIENLEKLISSNWNFDNAPSLLSEFKLIATGLLKKKILTEDIIVGKLRKVLPDQFLQAGLLSQGIRRAEHMFIPIEEAVIFVKKAYSIIKREKENDAMEIKPERKIETTNYTPGIRKKLCVYCDNDWHTRKDCIYLSNDLKDRRVIFGAEGNICYPNGKEIALNYEKGGMKELVHNQISANLCTITPNFYGGEDAAQSVFENFKVENDVDIDVMLAKRQIQSGEKVSRKRPNVSSSILPETSYASYPIGHKLGLPNINTENEHALVESTLNTIIPVTIRQLIRADPDYRKSLIDVIKQRKIPIQGPQNSDNIPLLEKTVNNIYSTNESTKSSSIIKLPGKLNNHPVEFTFDTGAMVNLVSSKTVDLMEKNGIYLKSNPTTYNLKGVYGNSVSTSYEIPNLTDSDSFDVLLGMPWIKDVNLMSHIQENGEINFQIKSNINNNKYNFKVEIEPNMLNGSRNGKTRY